VAAGHTRREVVNRSPHAPQVSTDGVKGALGFLDLRHRTSADNPRSACLFVNPSRRTLALTTDARGSAGGLQIPEHQGIAS